MRRMRIAVVVAAALALAAAAAAAAPKGKAGPTKLTVWVGWSSATHELKPFKKAGLTRPPKTMSELAAYAKKLTQKNADGSLKVVGYTPFSGFYDGAPVKAIRNAQSWGAQFMDAKGHSILGSDPAWAKALK